jgi:hypothetical protein
MEAVEALEGTATLIEMHKALRNYARQFTHVRSLLQQLHSHSTAISDAVAWFTWAEFCWAASVSTRSLCSIFVVHMLIGHMCCT